MMDAIGVLNAGSSSIKFSVFAAREEALELTIHGQAEALYTAPRFLAKDSAGHVVAGEVGLRARTSRGGGQAAGEQAVKGASRALTICSDGSGHAPVVTRGTSRDSFGRAQLRH